MSKRSSRHNSARGKPNNPLNPYEQAIHEGDDWFYYYYNYLVELALSIFEWKNLPDTVDPRYLELSLLEFGHVLFFKDKYRGLGFMVSQVALSGRINHYLTPTTFYTSAPTYSAHEYTLEDSVPIFNNYMRTPTFPALRLYAQDLAEITQIIKVNQNAQKTPVAIAADDYNKLTLKNAFNQVDGNSPVLLTDKSFDPMSMKALNFSAPYVVDKLQYQKNMRWNEIMTFLGINNANMDKKERVQSAEANSNNEQVNMSRFNMQKAREEAANSINEMFGLEIEVVPRETGQIQMPTMFGGDMFG
jgi:hypothetical protein